MGSRIWVPTPSYFAVNCYSDILTKSVFRKTNQRNFGRAISRP